MLAAAYAALRTVHTASAFAALSCMIAIAMALSKGANGALAAGAVPAAQRLHAQAYLRSATNAGIGAALIAVACVLFGLTVGRPSWAVGLLVLLAAVVQVLGELWLSTGSWAIVYGLAPDSTQGRYQGTYFAGRQIGDMVAPPLIRSACSACIPLGGSSWPLFVTGGLAYRPIAVGGRLVNVA